MNGRDIAGSARHPAIAAAFLASAIVLGGGGSPNPATEILLQLCFVVAGVAWLWAARGEGRVPMPSSRLFWLVCGLVLALPVLQLVPLPASAWTALGAQDDRIAALALVGRDGGWQPLSRSAPRTLASLLAIVPALFAFFATASLDTRGRSSMVGTIVGMALVTVLLGSLQLSMGDDGPYLYTENHHNLTGFQANRNATADILLIGMVAAAALLAPSLAGARERPFARLANPKAAGIALAALIALLFLATIFTASRAGIALLPLVLLGVWVIIRPALAGLGRLQWLPLAAALAAVPVVALVAFQGGNTALGKVAERFVFEDDARRELWRDGWFAMQQAWPFGVGLGGAQPALIAAERLEVLDPALPNRVHNDYLELALEGGLPALVLLAALAAVLAWAAWCSWRERPDERHLTSLGVVVLLVAALHSLVDYPLRSMALACLIGTGAGLLIGTPGRMAGTKPGALSGESA